jgi:hypothetical protein
MRRFPWRRPPDTRRPPRGESSSGIALPALAPTPRTRTRIGPGRGFHGRPVNTQANGRQHAASPGEAHPQGCNSATATVQRVAHDRRLHWTARHAAKLAQSQAPIAASLGTAVAKGRTGQPRRHERKSIPFNPRPRARADGRCRARVERPIGRQRTNEVIELAGPQLDPTSRLAHTAGANESSQPLALMKRTRPHGAGTMPQQPETSERVRRKVRLFVLVRRLAFPNNTGGLLVMRALLLLSFLIASSGLVVGCRVPNEQTGSRSDALTQAHTTAARRGMPRWWSRRVHPSALAMGACERAACQSGFPGHERPAELHAEKRWRPAPIRSI